MISADEVQALMIILSRAAMSLPEQLWVNEFLKKLALLAKEAQENEKSADTQ